MRVIFIVATLVALAAVAWVFLREGDYEKGYAAYKQHDYQTALELWEPAANREDARAQRGLGALYAHGLGVERNYGKAVEWLRMAEKQAEYTSDALRMAELALEAQGGDAEAAYQLGLSLYRGQIWIASEYEHPASEQGKEWYRLAADLGHPRAQLFLGRWYWHRDTPPKFHLPHIISSYKWLSLAASNTGWDEKDRKKAAAYRDKLIEIMTTPHIAEARKLVERWTPRVGTPANLPPIRVEIYCCDLYFYRGMTSIILLSIIVLVVLAWVIVSIAKKVVRHSS